jgi:hypothetical protein
VIWLLSNRWWLPLCIVPLLLLGIYYRQRLRSHWRAAATGLVLATVLLGSLQGLNIIRNNIARPPEWDFGALWLDGRVGAFGLNFYDPQSYRQIADTLSFSQDFRQEIVEVGFRYPPMTMLLLAPFGWLDMHNSIVIWMTVQVIALIADIFLIRKLFFERDGLAGLAWSAALVLLLGATFTTIGYAQTNFIVLLMLLLFWCDHESPHGGAWLALGICVKPILACVLLYPLLRRQWRVIGSAMAALAFVCLLAVLLFGATTFASYLTVNPTMGKTPSFVYSEPVNQSLLATVLRTTGGTGATSPVKEPVFIALAAALTAVTSLLVYRLRAGDPAWALAAMVPLALLLYPGTLEHYSLLLILPFLLLWQRRDQLPIGLWTVVAFITLEYGLIGRGGRSIFIAMALCWLLFVGVGFWNHSRYRLHARSEGFSAPVSSKGEIT